jgi:hypothetical protein
VNQRELEHQSAALHHTTPRDELTRDILDGALFLAALTVPVTICTSCRKPCEITTRDDSFDHEFGTQRVYSVVSVCCGARARRERA